MENMKRNQLLNTYPTAKAKLEKAIAYAGGLSMRYSYQEYCMAERLFKGAVSALPTILFDGILDELRQKIELAFEEDQPIYVLLSDMKRYLKSMDIIVDAF